MGVVVAEHLDRSLRLLREATSANRQWDQNSKRQEHHHRLLVNGWTIAEFIRTVSRHCSCKAMTTAADDLSNHLHQELPLHPDLVVHLPRHQGHHLSLVEHSLQDLVAAAVVVVVVTGDEVTNDSPASTLCFNNRQALQIAVDLVHRSGAEARTAPQLP